MYEFMAPPTTPEGVVDPGDRGTVSTILHALDAPRRVVARPLLDAIAPWELEKDDPASGSSFISAISQAIVPGQRHSVSRAIAGTLVEEEWKPESMVGQIAYAVAGLPIDIALDPLTYVGVGVLTKAGRAAAGGVKGAKLAATWAKQAEVGDRALISVLGRPVIRVPEVFEAAGKAWRATGKGVDAFAKYAGDVEDFTTKLAEWGNRSFHTTVGLSPLAKRKFELEGLRRAEVRNVMREAVQAGVRERDVLDDLARSMGIVSAELDERLIKMIDAPKANVRAIDGMVASGHIPKDLADRAKGFLEFDRDLLKAQQDAGVEISDLGLVAYERDMAKLAKSTDKAAYRVQRAQSAMKNLPGVMDARKQSEAQHLRRVEITQRLAQEEKNFIESVLANGFEAGHVPTRIASRLVELDDALRVAIGKADETATGVARLKKREARLRALAQTEPAALTDMEESILRTKARVNMWTDVEREHVGHLVTPQALEHLGNLEGLGGVTAAEKAYNTIGHIMAKIRPGQAKMRTLDMDLHAANKYAREHGLLPPGVDLFEIDPSIIKARSVLNAGTAISYAHMEKKLFEEFGVQVAKPELMLKLTEVEKVSKALGNLEDTMTLEQMRRQFARNKPYWAPKKALEAKLERLTKEIVEQAGGLRKGETYDAAMLRIGALADSMVPKGHTLHKTGKYAGVAIPDEIASWQTIMTRAKDPAVQRGFIQNVWMPIQRWWAGWALFTPGFHARNVLGGNLWMNYLRDVGDVRDYVTAMLIQSGAGQGKISGWIVRAGKRLGASGRVAEHTYDEVWQMAHVGGLIDSDELAEVMRSASMATDIAQAVLDQSKRGAKNSRLIDFVPFLPTGNNQLLATNLKVGSGLENNAKLAHLVAKLRAGWSPESAIASAKQALFDYRNMGDVDRKIKQVAPFWTWTRNNVPKQVLMLMAKPGKFARVQQFKQAVEHLAGDTVPEGILPEWQKEGVPIQMGRSGEKGGERALFVLNNYWPGADMSRIAGPKAMGRAAIDLATPLLKMPFEQISNIDTFRSLGMGEVVRIDRGHQVAFLGSRVDARLAHAMRALVPLGQLDRGNPGNWFGHRPDQGEYPNGASASIGLIPGAELADTRDRDDPIGTLRAAQGIAGIRPYHFNPEQELQFLTSEWRRETVRLEKEQYGAAHSQSKQQMEQTTESLRRLNEAYRARRAALLREI